LSDPGHRHHDNQVVSVRPSTPGDFDPLGDRGRNEPCWCGSGKKYKACHGDHLPGSKPGDPVPADTDEGIYISPNTVVAPGAFSNAASQGAPILMPTGKPEPSAVVYTNWDQHLASATPAPADAALSPERLGRLRVAVLRELAALPMNDSPVEASRLAGYYALVAESLRTVASLGLGSTRPTLLWNAELDVATFLSRTLLLADHALYPDRVFDAILREGSNADLRQAARKQLAHRALLATGAAIPLPQGVPMASQGQTVHRLTASDLANPALVEWVRHQLVMEGPTAREVLLVHARDDLQREPGIWMYGHIEPGERMLDDGRFTTAMLQAYDPSFDYTPWIRQVSDEAVSKFVQRTNERQVTAATFGAEYVSTSLFETRLIRRRPNPGTMGAAQAAVLADIPLLTDLSSPDLGKLLANESAVEDLRREVRATLTVARTDGERTDTLTALAHELEAKGTSMTKTSRHDTTWQGVMPAGLAAASLVVGGTIGTPAGWAAGGLGVLGTALPYFGNRLKERRSAAYLFVLARRRRH